MPPMMPKAQRILRNPFLREAYHTLVGRQLRANLKHTAQSLGARLTFQNTAPAGLNGLRIEQLTPEHIMRMSEDGSGPDTARSSTGTANGRGPDSDEVTRRFAPDENTQTSIVPPKTPPPRPRESTNGVDSSRQRLTVYSRGKGPGTSKAYKWSIRALYATAFALSVAPFGIVAGAIGLGWAGFLIAPLIHGLIHLSYVRPARKRGRYVRDSRTSEPPKAEESRGGAAGGANGGNGVSLSAVAQEARTITEKVYSDDEAGKSARVTDYLRLNEMIRTGVLPQETIAFVESHITSLERPLKDQGRILTTTPDNRGESAQTYVITTPLGKGGMGKVYEAVEPSSGQVVAIKLLNNIPEDPNDKITKPAERFALEYRVLKALDNPHIVRAYAQGVSEDGCPFYVMARLRGETLLTIIRRNVAERKSGEAPSHAIGVTLEVIDGLMAASAEGKENRENALFHRDISPDNIFRVPYDAGGGHQGITTVLTDFGLAKEAFASQEMTEDVSVKGKMSFRDPHSLEELSAAERLRMPGDQKLMRYTQSDIYSLGVVLYGLLTNEKPFMIKDVAAYSLFLHDVKQGKYPVVQQRNIPENLFAVIQRMISLDLAHRFPNYAELRADLRTIVEGTHSNSKPPSGDDRTKFSGSDGPKGGSPLPPFPGGAGQPGGADDTLPPPPPPGGPSREQFVAGLKEIFRGNRVPENPKKARAEIANTVLTFDGDVEVERLADAVIARLASKKK